MFSRRSLLAVAVATTLSSFGVAFAADAPIPIVFVHGDSDQAANWQTTFWRFETNGYPRDRLFAIDFLDPQARSDDAVAQENRSSTADELKQLSDFVADVRRKTGAAKVALVANSRGGYAIRNFLAHGGAAQVERAVLCGTPNHGVFALDSRLGSEYNGKGPFLSGLNAGDREVPADVPVLTLRSEGFDKYAQPDGKLLGFAGVPTNVDSDGPALRGATNLGLDHIDHRETGFGPRAFVEMYKFIVGAAPSRIAIASETEATLNGKVTDLIAGTPTNRPIAGADLEIYLVDAETGERKGAALLKRRTGADGVWGPVTLAANVPVEFVIAAPNAPITHIYRSGFPRSFANLNLRPTEFYKEDAQAEAVVRMNRPRGYYGLPRDIVLLDGREPSDVTPGVPTDWRTTMRQPAYENRAVVAEFNQERIVVRTWPSKDNHITIAELTY